MFGDNILIRIISLGPAFPLVPVAVFQTFPATIAPSVHAVHPDPVAHVSGNQVSFYNIQVCYVRVAVVCRDRFIFRARVTCRVTVVCRDKLCSGLRLCTGLELFAALGLSAALELFAGSGLYLLVTYEADVSQTGKGKRHVQQNFLPQHLGE